MNTNSSSEKATNVFELTKLLNTTYRITSDEGIDLCNAMEAHKHLTGNYQEEIKKLTGEEQNRYQTEYNYKLYLGNYQILKMQKNITYKAYHSKRLMLVRKMLEARDANNREAYKGLLIEYIDKLIEEVNNELKLTSEIARTIPHFRNSCIAYCNSLYQEVQLEKIKLEMQPELQQIKDSYNRSLNEIVDSTNAMFDKTDTEKRTIISKKKELLDARANQQLLQADEKLKKRLAEKNKTKENANSYTYSLHIVEEMKELFSKIKKDGSMLNADSKSVRKLEKSEIKFNELEMFLSKFSDNEVERQRERAIQLKESMEIYKKFQFTEEDKKDDSKKINFQKNQILKYKSCASALSEGITISRLASEDGIVVLDDLISAAGLDEYSETNYKARA